MKAPSQSINIPYPSNILGFEQIVNDTKVVVDNNAVLIKAQKIYHFAVLVFTIVSLI